MPLMLAKLPLRNPRLEAQREETCATKSNSCARMFPLSSATTATEFCATLTRDSELTSSLRELATSNPTLRPALMLRTPSPPSPDSTHGLTASSREETATTSSRTPRWSSETHCELSYFY